MSEIKISDGKSQVAFEGVVASVDGAPIGADESGDIISAPAYVLIGVDRGEFTDAQGSIHPLTKGAYVLLREHGLYRLQDVTES